MAGRSCDLNKRDPANVPLARNYENFIVGETSTRPWFSFKHRAMLAGLCIVGGSSAFTWGLWVVVQHFQKIH